MGNINYSFKAKCQGCQALQCNKEVFTCLFGIPLLTQDTAGNQTAPAPNAVKCYKPKTSADLKAAKVLMERKTAKESA